jgi:hypothetical protein
MTEPPLHWAIDAHALHASASFSFQANAQELEAIKRYAEIEQVASFKAEVKVSPLSGGRFRATGALNAEAVQASIIDLSSVPASIDETFSVEFWPEETLEAAEEDSNSFEAETPEAFSGGKISIGAFLCELFSVSLDPYPRNPSDNFEWKGDERESGVSPFAELEQLRRAKEAGKG